MAVSTAPLFSTQIQPQTGRKPDIDALNRIALGGLERMFVREEQLFCFRMRVVEGKLIREGLSRRYSLMCLLGLDKAEKAGYVSPVPVRETAAKLLHDAREIDNLGDFGLLLWLCAHTVPDLLMIRSFALNVQEAMERFPDAHEGRTMELAWFLAGICECTLAGVSVAGGQGVLAEKAWRLLRRNWGNHGYFVQSGKSRGLEGMVRGRIGSFAEQVYPIYALTRYAQAYGCAEALQLATECAKSICSAQGPLGQWWWHYDASQGSVIGRYPVYSVHQHGMGPLALFAISEAGSHDFTPNIYRGLEWITGANELKFDMCSEEEDLIWRSIYRNRRKRILSEAFNLLVTNGDESQPSDLGVKWECCPYELGWLLFALAGQKNINA